MRAVQTDAGQGAPRSAESAQPTHASHAIEVIAEGVETAKQLRLLQEWGCQQAQGFYFANPLPVEDVTLLLRRGNIMRGAARKRGGLLAVRTSDPSPRGDDVAAVHQTA